MPSQFSKWLSGQFVCSKCGRSFLLDSLGFGSVICPDCYSGEDVYISWDERYWLNRVLCVLAKRGKIRKSVGMLH